MAEKKPYTVTLEDNLGAMPDVHAVLMSSGITPQLLAKKLKEELNAKSQKAFNNAGEIVYSEPMVDWGIRQKARMDAQKLLNMYPAEKHEVTGADGGPMQSETNLSPELQELVNTILGPKDAE